MKLNEWKDQQWHGNPSLNLPASVKKFGGIPVYVWGKENNQHTLPPPATPDYVFGALNFTVSDGANSSYSYSGLCVDCFTLDDAKAYVENLSTTNKLI